MTISSHSYNYQQLDRPNKLLLLQKLYVEQELSFADISKLLNETRSNIRHDIISGGIVPRTRSEAQKLVLKQGKSTHPTKDKGHSEETKLKLSEKAGKYWDNVTPEVYNKRAENAQTEFNGRSQAVKDEFFKKSHQAIRAAAINGSKLEQILHVFLIDKGYRTIFHREHLIINEKMHIDIMLPEKSIVIEIDGPTHFQNVFGEKELERVKKSDVEKNGLLIAKGFTVIRIQHEGDISKKYIRFIKNKLLETIKSKPQGLIILGEEDEG